MGTCLALSSGNVRVASRPDSRGESGGDATTRGPPSPEEGIVMVRSLPSVAAAVLVGVGLSQSPAAAQDLLAANTASSAVLYSAVPLAPVPASVTLSAAAVATKAESASPAESTGPKYFHAFVTPKAAPSRPIALPALYAMQAGLQAMDVRSTFTAISLGAHEANPIMKPLAKNQATMMAVKAGVAASTILMSEKMWRGGNKMGAIVSMVAANAVTAMVVAHNYRVVNQLQAR
jgi:Domain of unknown function (DUF5658)